MLLSKNVKMGRSATIYWDQVAEKPYIPQVPRYIQSTKITSTTIESPTILAGAIRGASIQGGTITSDTTIDVGTNLSVGKEITLQGTGNKTIWFSGMRGAITFDYQNDAFEIGSMNGLNVTGGRIYENGITVATTEYVDKHVVARFG
ncbi:hypothetical protein AZ66_29020 [Paenibacillus sp. E194]|nr:hypothetical protein AZ66_29020 [Paenibacillus sp. E194]